MRVPTTERRQFRVRGWMIAVVVLLLALILSLRGLAGVLVNFWWFDSLGQGDTWTGLLGAKAVPAVVFTAVFFAVVLANLVVADRIAPRVRPAGPPTPEAELVSRYQQATERFRGRIRIGAALFFALIAGIGVSAQWRNWVLFTNAVEVGQRDPQFDRDVGFYLFKLPFIQFLVDWLFAGLVIVLLVTAVTHYLNGGIRFQTQGQRVTPQVKMHLSVILAAMALVKAADYYFSRFDLTHSTRGAVDGAGYTDVHAQLPAFKLLMVIAVVSAGLFLWNIWRRGWVLPVIAAGVWALISLIAGTIYPAGIQEFKVKPNEFALERQFLARNIDATRTAFGLQNVDTRQFDYEPTIQPEVVDANRPTIDNARLWDPEIVQATYQTLQGLATYYRVNDVDIDRYTVDGQTTQVVISARDLNSAELASRSWVNERVVFTHGYGAVASPTNRSTPGGDPLFFLSDIPTRSEGIELSGRGAEVYFGEELNEYVVVNAKQDEFNFAREGGRNSRTRYQGEDGITVSNVFKRAAFALEFGDFNLLISGQIQGDSRVLMRRNVRDRVQELAPFLEFDADPYPVALGDRLVWVIDGYTTSNEYPYSQSIQGSGGLGGDDINYARNSVKATVDAYDGTVTFYVIDPTDPLIQAYRGAFPDLFAPFSAMPRDLRDHLRYPEDLFTLQSEVFAEYHVTQPQRFYEGDQRWLLSPDPESVVRTASTGGTRGTGRAPRVTAETPRQDPYYLYIRLPGDEEESFLILQPFVPVSQDNQQTRLVSFMTAKSDRDNYGRLEAFVMPQGRTVIGPVQVANEIQSDPALAEQFTLLSRGGSSVVRGNIQLIPVGNSVVYVQPIFVQRSGSQGYPQFRFAVVFNEAAGAPVQGTTVNDALNLLFGRGGESTTPDTPTTPGTDDATLAEILDEIAQRFETADQALRSGDLGRYQALIREVQDLVEQARALLAGSGGTESGADAAAAAGSVVAAAGIGR